MRKLKKSQKINLAIVLVIAVALVASIVALSIDFSKWGNPNDGGLTQTPNDWVDKGQSGTPGIGEIEPGTESTDGTPISNANKEVLYELGVTHTTGNFYLTEDITGFEAFRQANGNSIRFQGTLNGNGHTITAKTYKKTVTDSTANAEIGKGGFLAAINNATIKNLTFVIDTANEFTIYRANTGDADAHHGIGMFIGIVQGNSTLDNVRVEIAKGTTINVVSNNGANTLALGVVAGLAGGRAAMTVTFNRVSAEVNGKLSGRGSWVWMGGLLGAKGNSAWYTSSCTFNVNNCVVTGTGEYYEKGDANATNSARFGYVVGGTRKSGGINVNGFLLDFSGLSSINSGGNGWSNEASMIANNDGGNTQAVASNVFCSTRQYGQTWGMGYSSGTVSANKINTNVAVPTGITGHKVVPGFDASGNIMYHVSGLPINYYDAQGKVGSTAQALINGNASSTAIGASVCAKTAVTAEVGFTIMAPEEIGAFNASSLIDAVNKSRTIKLTGSFSIDNGFTAAGDYRGTFFGNGQTVTIGKATGGAASSQLQGGIFHMLYGARVENLNIVVNGSFERNVAGSGDGAFGFLAGGARDNTVIQNVHVTMKDNATVTVNASNRKNAVGGLVGVTARGVQMKEVSFDLQQGSNVKIMSGTGYGFFGGLVGTNTNDGYNANNGGNFHWLYVTNGLFTGGGRVELHGSQKNYFGGISGANRIFGGVNANNFVMAFTGTEAHNGTANTALSTNMIDMDAMMDNSQVNKLYYIEGSIFSAVSTGNKINVQDAVPVKDVVGYANGTNSAIKTTLGYDFTSGNITLSAPITGLDLGYTWEVALSQTAGGKQLDSSQVFNTVSDYTLRAAASGTYTGLGLYLVQGKALSLPDELKQYEHGYVPNSYLANAGYLDNPDWTPVSKTQNSSGLATLSGTGKYYLTEDVEIVGFASTSAFNGVLDGCGYTITITADAGSVGKDYTNGAQSGKAVGGLFAELGGTVKNLKLDIKASASRNTNSSTNLALGGLAGRLVGGAQIDNVLVKVQGTLTAGTVYLGNVGGVAGLVETNTKETPVVLNNVTVSLLGKLAITAGANWSWTGGFFGSTNNAFLNLNQIIFSGTGTLNNQCYQSAGKRAAGIIGGTRATQNSANQIDINGFIYAFEGIYEVGTDNQTGNIFVSDGWSNIKLENYYRMTAATDKGYYSVGGATPAFTEPKNITVIESSFSQRDQSVGYTYPVYDPGVAVGSEKALVVAAVFESEQTFALYLVARIEVVTNLETYTSSDTVNMINVFTFAPNANHGKIDLHIKAGSVSDGTASLGGTNVSGLGSGQYSGGWLTDNGRVPAGYGVPQGATGISSEAEFDAWVNGTGLEPNSVAYNYGYLTANLSMFKTPTSTLTLAKGRVFDGAGFEIAFETESKKANPTSLSSTGRTDWMLQATANSVSADVFGSLFAVNNGTIRNAIVISTRQNKERVFKQSANRSLVFGQICGVNFGLIENCSVTNYGLADIEGNGSANSAAIYGLHVGVNRGTIRAVTTVNDGTARVSYQPYQIILGGVAAVNDGGIIEYVTLKGVGLYEVSGTTNGDAGTRIMMGGVMGYGVIGDTDGASNVLAKNNGGTTYKLHATQGTMRYVVNSFTGKFNRLAGGVATSPAKVGTIAGFISENAGGTSTNNKAAGIFTTVQALKGWGRGRTEATGEYSKDVFFGSAGTNANSHFSGGFIEVKATGSVLKEGEQTYHTYWDYWGGTGTLVVEYNQSAAIKVGETGVMGGVFSFDPKVDDNNGTNTFRAPLSQMTPDSSAPKSISLNAGMQKSFADALYDYSHRGEGDSNTGGTVVTSSNFYSGGNTILRYSNNYYLDSDITIDVNNKYNGHQDNTSFQGTFDGRGHTITMVGDANKNPGGSIFGLLTDHMINKGTIKNLKIVYKARFKRSVTHGTVLTFSGIVVGDMSAGATIENVHFEFQQGSNGTPLFEVNHTANTHARVGLFAGKSGNINIKKVSVDFGQDYAQVAATGNGQKQVGLIGGMAEGTNNITDLYITGKGEFYAGNSAARLGLIYGEGSGNTHIHSMVLDNMDLKLRSPNPADTKWQGKFSTEDSLGSSATVKFHRINSFIGPPNLTRAVAGGKYTPDTATSLLGGSEKSFAEMIKMANDISYSTMVTNGNSTFDTTAASSRLYLSSVVAAKADGVYFSIFEADQKILVRNTEMGYFMWEVRKSTVTNSPGDGTLYAEAVYKEKTDSSLSPNGIHGLGIGQRGILNFVQQNADGTLSTAPAAVETTYNGSNKTDYAFRPVYYGAGGSNNTQATHMLGWQVGGEVLSGRIPTNDALKVGVSQDPGNPGYYYYNAAGYSYIKASNVMHGGNITVKVNKNKLNIESDTASEWKADSGNLTIRMQTPSNNNAIDQITYSNDGGVTWHAIAVNFRDGVATAKLTKQSLKGGSTLIVRGYSGISIVTEDAMGIQTHIDTETPGVSWAPDSKPINDQNSERNLWIDDVSITHLGFNATTFVTINGPSGHSMAVQMIASENGGYTVVTIRDSGNKISGDYTITITDLVGKKTVLTEYIDFAPPSLTATVTPVEKGGIKALNRKDVKVTLSLNDNRTDIATLFKRLSAKIVDGAGNVLNTFDTQNGGITATTFNTATGTGDVTLNMVDINYPDMVKLQFEVMDLADNRTTIDALASVFIDTRTYTLYMKDPLTDNRPFDSINFIVDGASVTAAPGDSSGILYVLNNVRLFSDITIQYTSRPGFTFDGFNVYNDVFAQPSGLLGSVADGTTYTIGMLKTDEYQTEGNTRYVTIEATEQLKLETATTPTMTRPLKNGNWSDTIADYAVEGGSIVEPDFANPKTTVFLYNTESGKFDKPSTAITQELLPIYFDISLIDPEGNAIDRTADGRLTFKRSAEDNTKYVEGTYTLRISVKSGYTNIYTINEGASVSITVSERGRRNILMTYDGNTSFEYNGERELFDPAQSVDVFNKMRVAFDLNSFEEDESPDDPQEQANLTALLGGLQRLNYTLYFMGVQVGSRVWQGDATTGSAVTTGSMKLVNVGSYALTVSIPISGSNKFNGVTGSVSFSFNVTRKIVTIVPTAQQIVYGNKIDDNAYTFNGLVAKDVAAGADLSAVLYNQVNTGVIKSMPKLSTEYTTVRVVNGVVTPYLRAISAFGAIADNYEFQYNQGDLTIGKRNIILKIADVRKEYGNNDPSLLAWELSATSAGTNANMGYGNRDNFISFKASNFRRDAGEDAFFWMGSGFGWGNREYFIKGELSNENYNVTVEDGRFIIDRREIRFDVSGDQGLIYEEGIKHQVTVKISNGLTKDKLSVTVNYSGNWIDIGEHTYALVVRQDGAASPSNDGDFANYHYSTANRTVRIGASILNVVMLPQVITYGDELNQEYGVAYMLEGLKGSDTAEDVIVTVRVDKESAVKGYHVGKIYADVSFRTGTGKVIDYTVAVRRGNLTVLPKKLDISWQGNFVNTYTGQAQTGSISAQISTPNVTDPIKANVRFDGGSSSGFTNTGTYRVSAVLEGDNSENYIVNPQTAVRQFVIEQSEQRISVLRSIDGASGLPRYGADKRTTVDGKTVYKAEINILELLSVKIAKLGGYQSVNTIVPTLELYSLQGYLGATTVNAVQKFGGSTTQSIFYLEPGMYSIVASLEGDKNYYPTTFEFRILVDNKQKVIDTSTIGKMQVTTNDISGAYEINDFNTIERINDPNRIGYVIGPSFTGDRNDGSAGENIAGPMIKTGSEAGRIVRLTGMNNAYSNDWTRGDISTANGKQVFGTHDGDWAYVFFNVSVSESMRQKILQGKVSIKLSYSQKSRYWGQYKKSLFESNQLGWRSSYIDSSHLGYAIREIGAGNDLQFDAADPSMIGLDASPYSAQKAMENYGADQGFKMQTEGVVITQAAQSMQLGVAGSQGTAVSTPDPTVLLSRDKIKSGSAFRIYLTSSTMMSTRHSVQLKGTNDTAAHHQGNKRNNFEFDNIQVTFVETGEVDTSAPTVTAQQVSDAVTGMSKFQYTVKDSSGIDINFSNVTVGGINYRVGNGLVVVGSRKKYEDGSPVYTEVIYETVIMTSDQVGNFEARDIFNNTYKNTPALEVDKSPPVFASEVQVTAGDNTTTLNEAFWYNQKQTLAVGVNDPSGVQTYRMYYIEGGSEIAVPTQFTSNKVTTIDPVGTGTYFVVVTDSHGNSSSKIINLLVDDTQDDEVSIVIDPKVTPGSWQDGDVVIQNTVTKFGNSFGRMYYATSDTDFKDTYQTLPDSAWLAMDANYIDGVFTMSESIKTAQMKYYAFKYVGGAASAPGANDHIKKFAYLGYIKIDREKPSISVDSYRVTDDLVVIDSLSAGQWTNNNVQFLISGSTGLSLGHIEYSLNGYSAPDEQWLKPGMAGYAIEYCNNLSVVNGAGGSVLVDKTYTQTLDDNCFYPNTAKTTFSYEARLVIRGHNAGSRYAFRFVSGSGAVATSAIGEDSDGFVVNIDTLSPDVTNINSSWQQGETSSQIFIREADSGIKNVTVYQQQVDGNGDGIFVDGKPVFVSTGEAATLSNGRWYYRFTGLWYFVKVEDNAGNIGQKEVKLKIDEKQPNVTLDIQYSNKYVAPDADADIGVGVWAAKNAQNEAYVDFVFTVTGGTSGYSFWYSNVGYTGVVSEWTMPTDPNFHKGELGDTETSYVNTFTFRVSAAMAKDYTFRFVSGAQRTVFYNFRTKNSAEYDQNTEDQLVYRVNIDSESPVLDELQYNQNGQWLPSYNDQKWQTTAVAVRFTAAEQAGLSATGLDRVTVVNGKGETITVTLKDGYYEFLMTDQTAYTITAYDKAGNKQQRVIDPKKIDTMTPVITADGNGYTEGDWTNGDVTLSYNLAYGASGISGILVTANNTTTAYTQQQLADGITFEQDINGYVTLKLTMVSGVVVTHNFKVCIDKTVAVVTVTGLPSDYTTAPQNITVSVADGLGSGVSTATLSAPAGFTTIDLVAQGGSYTMVVSDWREYTVTVTDNAGNVTTYTFAANVDASKPENFSMSATSNGVPYIAGNWTTKDIELIFNVTFFEIEGNINYGNIEYRVNDGIWQVLFLCSEANKVQGQDAYRYTMTGEADANYEFRAITLAGNASEDTVPFGNIKLNTVPTTVDAVGSVGETEFVPSDKGYTWVPGNIDIVFDYTVGISTGRLYYEYKQNVGDSYQTHYLNGVDEAVLTAQDADGAYTFTIVKDGFYRFVMYSLADPDNKLVVDYGEIRRDVERPSVSIDAFSATQQGAEGDRYVSGTWTANSVVLVVTLTFGASYADSVLRFTTSSGDASYQDCVEYDQALLTAMQTPDGKWKVVYKMLLDQNQVNNYSFRAYSGAGVQQSEVYQRPGGAVRIDKNRPVLTIDQVIHKGDKTYAELSDGAWVSNVGWTNGDIRFTFTVRTYASGGTLKYKYGNMPGFVSDNISTVGGSTTGSDGIGTYIQRTYQLTLAGASLAIDSSIQFRVESGAGQWSHDAGDTTAIVPIKVDKRAPALDENSIQKTPSYPVGSFTDQTVTISFKVYDPEVGQIKSDIKEVRAGYFTDSDIGTVITATEGRYSVSLENSRDYYIQIIDHAGNSTMYKLKENIDKEAPELVVNTGYVSGLTTSPIDMDFVGSTQGVSGAVMQYRKNGGDWITIGGIDSVFRFAADEAEKLKFSGLLEIRALSGAGVPSVDIKQIQVVQDLNDYRLSVVQKVVATGSYAESIVFVKGASSSQTAPTLKKTEKVSIRITERATFPFGSIKVNGILQTPEIINGVYSLSVEANDDNIDQNGVIQVEIAFAEVIEVSFNDAKLSQSIRVENGKNRIVTEPFTVSQGRQGFEYQVRYKLVKDAYGVATDGSIITTEVPQQLGTYEMIFEVTTGQESYSFAASAQGKLLQVYYFDLTTDNNNNTYYQVETAYDLAYIRYYQTGNEFRQMANITLTTTILERGDWNAGSLTNATYNGANYKIAFPKAVIGMTSLFGAEIAQGSEVKNVGLVYQDTQVSLAAGGSYAPFTQKVAGKLSNVYVMGTLTAIGGSAGTSVKIAGFAGEVAATGVVTTAYFGAKIIAVDVFSQAQVAGIANLFSGGQIANSYVVGSIIAASDATANLFTTEGTGTLQDNVAVKGTLTVGTTPVNETFATGVQYVKYWDLINESMSYASKPILNETFRPNASVVSVRHLVNTSLNGLVFSADEQGNYYIPVTTAEQLKNVDNYPWADFRQEADIDCAGQAISIADTSVFSGTYDGGGYTIKNIRVTSSGKDGYGLFGTVIGTIKNVVVKELTVTLPNISGQQAVVGGLVRNLMGGTVSNVSIGGTIVAGNNAKLTVGGVIGKAQDAIVENVLSTVSVTTDAKTQLLNAGSVIGAMKNSSVINVYSIAKVDANFTKRASVGQLIGEIEAGGASSVKNGYAVEGVTYVNGFSRDTEIGYDGAGADKADFGFVAFEDMMNPQSNSTFIVNGKHISVTLKTLFPFAKGSGTMVDPFEISNVDEFKLIGNYLYANYVVTKDIDFDSKFETIGKGMKFTGTIAGRNTASETMRSISGVTDALFDQNYGSIRSLAINVTVNKNVMGNVVFGAVANYNYGKIELVSVTGAVNININGVGSATVGGIAGINYKTTNSAGETVYPGLISRSTADVVARISAIEVRYGGVIGVLNGGVSQENVVQSMVNIIAVRGVVGLLVGDLQDPNGIVRKTIGGVAADVKTASFRVNYNLLAVDEVQSLHNKRID